MRPVGYTELIERFGLEILAPESRSYVLERGHRRSEIRDGHRIESYPARAYPGTSWTDHLVFALKREAMNLEVLAALFAVVPTDELTDYIRRYPTGRYARLAWFLFEWLTDTTLPVPDLTRGNYFLVLDPDAYLAVGPADVSARVRRQRIRESQNYVGQSLVPGRELIHYVPPKPEDVSGLMSGWEECGRRIAAAAVHPVVAAALLGFGFVFIHPFVDGNGRLHRFLIHHALAAGRFTPEGVIFPVSAVMLRERVRYDATLEWYSREVMLHVEYELDEAGVLTVLGETAPYYRYPDLTWVTQELFGLIKDTVEREFAAELDYLAVFDKARRDLTQIVDMPDSRLDLFIRLSLQGRGRLSRTKRVRFDELTDDEVARMEAVMRGALARLADQGSERK
ncbi:MAG: Fic family protein [Actinobacteria bacterium]|nr:Fic family protein [Actinomycetota bacterium]